MRVAAALVAAALLFVPGPLSSLAAEGPLRMEASAPDPYLPAEADGSVRHAVSGVRFPATLATMPVRRKVVFAPDDVGVTYSDRGGGNDDPWVDVFVYRATSALAVEADGMVESVRQKWALDRPIAPPPLPPAAAGGISRWFHGRVSGRAMTTGFVIVEREGWWIAARGSSPDEAGQDGVDRLMNASAALPWSVPARLSRGPDPPTRSPRPTPAAPPARPAP